ncbi:transmembrane protein 179-like isoform X2 [Pollicipes pollicipes]|nr:transmembrane protein 179-like isoform X2 [Pollicipes pollicipes]XP_037090689.1 transmembrane protein 179-like isoform X2 [Pollicipes pollicipes]XP_037090694.1 transmembrane protein 179-like isoform X2 [Pollicipes pollicipes]XP_037090695.1 transmembrane protein 179-like isoform X2 [Pollicipes pollicipes]XP_037090696.1 transmembrane protein 179-like isoform X2 [Pollicipes pollicipes]
MVLAAQLTGYLVSICLSLVVLVPMVLNLKDFRHKCLLFTTGDYREEDGQFVPVWASCVYCYYVMVVAASIIFICIVQGARTLVFLRNNTDTSFAGAFVDMILCIVITFASLAAALFVTLGYEVWCNNITKRFATCSDATQNEIDAADQIDTTNFYLEIGMAQFGAWCLWSASVGLTVCAVLKMCRHHHDENIRSSMARERERQRIIRSGRSSRYDNLVEDAD